MIPIEALIPYARSELVSLWHQHGVIEREEHQAEGTRLSGRLPSQLIAQVRPFQVRRRRARAAGAAHE